MRASAVIFLSLAICVGGCGDHRALSAEDTWYKPEPNGESRGDRYAVPCVPVKASGSNEAERRLANSDFIPISNDDVGHYLYLDGPNKDAAKLFDPSNEPNRSRAFFLVRCLYLNRDTGHFSATFDGTNLFVHHGSLGHSAVLMKRQPLIVALPKPPSHVYVTVSMAE